MRNVSQPAESGSAGPIRCAADQHRRARGGFTLLEILIVLAIIGLITSAVSVGITALLRTKPATPEDVFWKAISEARKYALMNEREVRLSYDSKSKTFSASAEDGAKTFPVDVPGEIIIEFLSATSASGSFQLLGGTLMESKTIPYVTFYGDGTCSPFRAQLRVGLAGTPRVLAIDPWTCAPVLEAAKK